MQQRLRVDQADPEAYKAMMTFEGYVQRAGLDPKLKELIKIRASQINGCAFCINMHTKDARKTGETEQRIYGLNAWRETPFYSDKERAVLALTEAVTLISHNHVPDDVYTEMTKHFDEVEITKIMMAIIAINSWNRLAITVNMMPEMDK